MNCISGGRQPWDGFAVTNANTNIRLLLTVNSFCHLFYLQPMAVVARAWRQTNNLLCSAALSATAVYFYLLSFMNSIPIYSIIISSPRRPRVTFLYWEVSIFYFSPWPYRLPRRRPPRYTSLNH